MHTCIPRGNSYIKLVQKACRLDERESMLFCEQFLEKPSKVLLDHGLKDTEVSLAIMKELFQDEERAREMLRGNMGVVRDKSSIFYLLFATAKNNKERTIHSGKN